MWNNLNLKYFDAEDLGLTSFHSGPKIHCLYYKGIQISSIDSNEYFICFINVRGSQTFCLLFPPLWCKLKHTTTTFIHDNYCYQTFTIIYVLIITHDSFVFKFSNFNLCSWARSCFNMTVCHYAFAFITSER